MGLVAILGSYTKRGRRAAKAAHKYEKARAAAALRDVQSAIGFRELEDPREQAALRQSAFARGLGKSTIEQQDRARLTDIQARRMAALRRQEDLGVRGLELIRLRRKSKQQLWNIADQIVAGIVSAGQAAGGMAGRQGATVSGGGGSAVGWQGAAGGMAGGMVAQGGP